MVDITMRNPTVWVVEQQLPATIKECGYRRRVIQNKSWDCHTVEEAVAKANRLQKGRVRIAQAITTLEVRRTAWVEKQGGVE